MAKSALEALEALAQEEMHKRDVEAYQQLLQPVREKEAKQKESSQAWAERANQILRDRMDQQREMEAARAQEEAEKAASRPEDTREAYRQLLRGMKGEE